VVGHNLLDEVVFLFQHHMADIIIRVAFSANMTGLTTAVAGLHEGFEILSAVDIYQDARGKRMQRGVHCCRGRGGGGICVEE
jgi:hypothetical protein